MLRSKKVVPSKTFSKGINKMEKFARMKLPAPATAIIKMISGELFDYGFPVCSLTTCVSLYTEGSQRTNISAPPADALGNRWLEIFNRGDDYEAIIALAKKIAKKEGLELIEPFGPFWTLLKYLSSRPYSEQNKVFLIADLVVAEINGNLSVISEAEVCEVFCPPENELVLTPYQGPFNKHQKIEFNNDDLGKNLEVVALGNDPSQVFFSARLA
jgi:hypothetical protein